jgi:hypothetical protein
MSVYDWSSTPYLASSDRWKELVNNRYGLAWQARFATQHRKPISFPEWGLAINVNAPGYGGGDNPTFIQNMYSWFGSHNTAFENYFDSDTDYGIYYGVHTGSGRFPVASATYQQLYSGSSAQPTGRGSLRSRASFARTSGSPLP